MNPRLEILALLSALAPASLAQGPAKVPQPIPCAADVKTVPLSYAKEDAAPGAAATRRASAAAADRAAVSDVRTQRVVDDDVHWDTDADGTIWARGVTFKAAFGDGRAMYVPFLGSDAPANYPVTFRIADVTIGEESIPFDERATAVRDGDAVLLDRGAFVERYVVGARSVEQTFVFADRIHGDVVVTVAVETELASATDADGFRFENELGSVRYGRAFAVDAAGGRVALAAELAGGAIRIRVPRVTVDAAEFPLTIDPVTTTFAVNSDFVSQIRSDTAYDASTQTFVTCFQEFFSGLDSDVRVIRHSSTGTITGDAYVDQGTTNWIAPRIAHNAIGDDYLVVATAGAAPSRNIWGRTVSDAATLSMSSKFNISGATGDHHSPDVGGDPASVPPTYFCVVWERELGPTDHDIFARLVNADGTLQGSTIYLEDSGGTVDHAPAISNSDGMPPFGTQNWNIVWEHETATDTDLQGARIRWDGTITSSTFVVASSSSDERQASVTPVVDDDGTVREYAVAYAIDHSGDWDCRVRVLDGEVGVATLDMSDAFPGSAALAQLDPSCDTDGHQFCLVYRQSTPPGSPGDIRAATLAFVGSGLEVTEGDISASPGSADAERPRIYARHSSGSAFRDALVVYDYPNASGGFDPYASIYDLPNGGALEPFCFGTIARCPCGNGGASGHGCASAANPSGALLTGSGTACVTSDSLVLHGSGMPATAPCLYFQGTGQSGSGAGTSFGDGLRCASGSVIRLGTKANSAGTSQFPSGADPLVHVRGAIPASGAVRNYQCWYRNSAAFCTSSTFNLSNGLRVVWVP